MSEIHILIVDDNPSIHIDFKKILCLPNEKKLEIEDLQAKILGKTVQNKAFSFLIDSAYQGEEALQIIRKGMSDHCRYSLAFVDIRMPPGMDGVETSKRIWELDPEIQIVICTAYSDYSWEELTTRLGETDRLLILKKPFENIEVQQLANALANKWTISQQLREHLENLEQIVKERTFNLAQSLSLVKATFEAATDGILVLNKEHKIVDYNQRFLQILHLKREIIEYSSEESLIKIISDQLESPQDFLTDIKSYDKFGVELLDILNFKDGRIIKYFVTAQRVENEIVGRIVSFRDITERQKMENELVRQVTHDTLTGLANRILLFDRIHQGTSSAKRNGLMVAILFIDLDYFKQVNDVFGHDMGDYVLKVTADRLVECVREGDTIARLGGDEFAIVLPNIELIDAIIPICQKIMHKVAEPIAIKEQVTSFTASIGISLYPKDGKDAKILVKNADIANHAAKELRNDFKFFTMELNIAIGKRLTLENNLRSALEKNEFILHYQPLVDIATGNLVGVEALLRWQHPKLGLIPPQEFIPVAEETGLMLPIGDWVLTTACTQNKKWQNEGFPPIRMAVNLTGKQLAQTNFIEKIVSVLNKTGLDASYLELELVESALIEGTDRTIRTLQEIKNVGVKIVIDDFGTGYSSLSYLNHLPIDKIKIDRSFISYISPNPADVAVIRAIIAIAKSLKITVLGEGVETKAQLDFLKKNHCDETQGYYICRPTSAEDLNEILQKGNPFNANHSDFKKKSRPLNE